MKLSVRAYLLFLVAVSLCFAAATKLAISGRVLDPSDNPIYGVRIQAYRDNRSTGNPVTSNGNGEYRVEFDSGSPIDTVRYDQSDWYPGTVQNISGKNAHTVHKVLYRRGQSLSALEAEDVICAFERIVDIDIRNETQKMSLTEYRYREALDEIDKLPLPPELKERIRQIKKKYGIPVAPESATSSPPQTLKPGPEHGRLHYFVGDWETSAEAKPSPFGPGGKITAKAHNQMFGNLFVTFHGESTGPMGQQENVAVMGYDPKQKVYTYDGFTTSGEHTKATGTVSGNTWRWTFNGEEQGKSFKGRLVLTEDSPTSYSFSEEMSIDGGPWGKIEEGKATKTK